MYAFDTGPLSALFRNYYPARFRTLWNRFAELVAGGRILSTREVFREVQDAPLEDLRQWAQDNQALFSAPTAAEAGFVAKIYRVAHFQQNIEQQKLLKGGRNADPFVIAKAAIDGCSVVTMELLKPNSAKIPNICQYFDVPCLTLESFMEAEGWTF